MKSQSDNTLTLTANQRIALRLQEAHDLQQIEKGLQSWPTPPILSLNSWLSLLAQHLIPVQILSSNQEQYVWEQIIRKTCSTLEVLNPADTASIAASAWQTLNLWGIDINDLATESNEEVAIFYQWALQFKQQCQQHNWLTSSEIPKKIIEQLPTLPYKTIQLVGFDDLPPLMNQLLEKIELSLPIIKINSQQEAKSLQKTALHDQQNEINAMAVWAKDLITQHPQAKIGCIIPELNTLRRNLFNTFTQVLDPNQLLPGQSLNKNLFNMSAGQKLSEYPMISTALTVINWLTNKIDLKSFGTTLQSPYLHRSLDERDYAAQLDRALRELDECEQFSDIFRVEQNGLLKQLYALNLLIKAVPDDATLSEWKHIFCDALTAMSWPGYRVLNSEDYQLYARWQLLLDEFTQYDSVTNDSIPLSEALYLLRKLATSTLFQTEGSLAPIQILGTLEAAGNTFDYLWIMGMDDDTWPPMANPNPFIPYELQRQHYMPHATAERELIYTEQVMHRLRNSATHIMFSYPLFEGDKAKSPSQLIDKIAATAFIMPHALPAKPVILESLADWQGPAVDSADALRLSSSTLQQQSDCPFKAFANTRLKAKPLTQPSFALPDNQRGLLTHDALDRIWHQLKSQQQLNELSHSELTHVITTTVDAVINDQQLQSAFKKELLALEKNRLLLLLEEWLIFEKARAPFTVTGTEVSLQIPISKLTFKVRIDRIDKLATGNCIIDYKTHTHSSINGWFGNRPNDPQLPLYLSNHADYTAIAYAEIAPNNCQFKGLANNDHTAKQIPGIKDIESFSKNTLTWDEQLTLWQNTIASIANEFAQGLASVTPQDPNKSCTYCELQPLCRVELS